MPKQIKHSIQKRHILFILCACILFLSWAMAESAVAHSGLVHLPFDLPACNARVLVCEAPVSSSAASSSAWSAQSTPEVPRRLEERTCLDGAGVPRSCIMTGPFQYMSQNLAMEKGGTPNAPSFPAMGETACVDGMAGPYPCSNIDLLSSLPLEDIGGTRGNDLWGWTDPIGGGEYAIMGLSDGTAFVDISNPTEPIFLGKLPSEDGKASVWRDIKVYDSHAFIVVDDSFFNPRSHGMQVFDLAQLPTAASTPQDLPITFASTTVYDEIDIAHNLAVNEETGYIYIVGVKQSTDAEKQCGTGLHMVDVTTPASPTFAGCFSDDGYTHDTQCVIYDGPDVSYQGSEICFNSNEDTLTIVDVTAKDNPVQISKAHYISFCADNDDIDCNRENGRLKFYTHQGWLSEDHAYFVQNDEIDESGLIHNTRTYMWNLQDLDNPQYIGNYTADISSFDHNLYIRDEYIFESNYRSGLRILDAKQLDAAQLFEVAYFDTYPSADGLDYDGAWSSYPFFESGVVAVSTIGEGLFLLRPSLSRAEVAPPVETPSPDVSPSPDVTPSASLNVYIPLVQK